MADGGLLGEPLERRLRLTLLEGSLRGRHLRSLLVLLDGEVDLARVHLLLLLKEVALLLQLQAALHDDLLLRVRHRR